MENQKVMTKEVLQLFLNGGKIVHRETYTSQTYLVRMPKGNFIQDYRNGMENNFFEYIIIGDLCDDGKIVIESTLNNTLRGAKKIMNESHKEKCGWIWRKNCNA